VFGLEISMSLLELREKHALIFQQVDALYQIFQEGTTFAWAGQSVDKVTRGVVYYYLIQTCVARD